MVQRAEHLAATTPSSKLRPPRVRHHELTRQALLEDPRVREAEILAIAAPAGFGKSTFAIQWASRSGLPVAWLTCDESDSDALVLMAGLSAAVAQCVADYQPPAGVPTLEEPSFSRTALPRFDESIAGLRTPITVVLDDLHHIAKEPARRVLRHFVNALPEGSQVAAVGRSLQAVPVPLWRGQGRGVDVGPAELAFGAQEVHQALALFHGRRVTNDEAERILESSQGWPVAVFLMSQAGRAQDVGASIDDFIQAEVLAPMSRSLRTFVLTTAALGTVNVDLAAAATGQQRSAHYLNQAITTVLLQRTPDDWFRYHPLLQECAANLLERENPRLLRTAQGKAACWHIAEGHIETAVRLAIDAGDAPTMQEVVWPAARLLLLRGRTSTVIDWLDTIGDRMLLRVPELSLAAAWTFIAASDYGRVLRFLEAALQAAPDDWRWDLRGQWTAPELILLQALTGYELAGPVQAAQRAAEAIAGMRPEDPTQALALTILGVNLTVVGDPEARGVLERAAATARSAGIPSTEVEARSLLGLLLMGDGEDDAGLAYAEQAAAVYAFHDLAQMTSTSGVLAIAEVARWAVRGDAAQLQEAIHSLHSALPALESLMPWYRALAGSVLAFASVRSGHLARFTEYSRWCEDSTSPPDALCRRWAERARREYAAASPLQALSPAELRVWELLTTRMTLSEIAAALFLSRETVKSHTVSIYRKLGVASRREAQDLAETWGCAAAGQRSACAAEAIASGSPGVGIHGSTRPSLPSYRGTTWMWKWKTVCQAAVPHALTRLTPSALSRSRARRAMRLARTEQWARSSSSISMRSAACCLGMTSAWPWVAGLMSMNARAWSVSAIRVAGWSPVTMSQKMQGMARA